MKVHAGECSYSDKVTRFWPEFGKNGKEDITIDMILNHRVAPFNLCFIGCCRQNKNFQVSKASSRFADCNRVMAKNSVFCRIDAKHRSIGEYFRDEIRQKYGAFEVCVTLSSSLHAMRAFEQPAVNGVATARGLALLHQKFMDGTLCSQQFFKETFDHTLGIEESKGHGFVYKRSPNGSWLIGHPAMGGQMIWMDPFKNIVVCYLTNGLKFGRRRQTRVSDKLLTRIYEILSKHTTSSSISSPLYREGTLSKQTNH
ncbi:unnamed protein product [Cylicostephanus goldi]|uniref:Beta-lactamase-related domain-containing protein n=1 Tax=Cylicostephanus goldi TaxID=71465 RepID=A0A3P6RS73_CYLGO|nr:unnamed protein product [Cylicostephanus goldi]